MGNQFGYKKYMKKEAQKDILTEARDEKDADA